MTLTQYSTHHKVTRKTAWNYFKRGLIPGAYQLPSGKIVVPDHAPKSSITVEETIQTLKDLIGRLEK